VRDRLQAAVADEPVAVDQRRPLRRTVAVRAVAARASAAGDLAMEDAIAQGDFFFRCPGRNGQCRRTGATGVRVSAFGRPGFAGGSSRRHRHGRGRDRRVVRAMESDPPNTTMLVVGNIKRAVETDGETGRAERRLTGLFNGTRKAIGKDDEIARGLAVLERLKHDIKAALRLRRAIPRAVERDESAALIRRREGGAGIDHQIVRRPMCGKCSDELLAPVYGWFTEGFDTRDLKEAKALLEEFGS